MNRFGKTVTTFQPVRRNLPRIVLYLGACLAAADPANAVVTVPGSLDFSNEQWPTIHVSGALGVYTQTTGVGHTWQVDMHYDPGNDTKVVNC